ncbi:hypothetical protein [Longispora albida]|uniref:hypothetical protein n=1 Tax=Longispora albida TaxID=203523 RepID=UPI00036ED0D6|nr:hypothetical protein [Longispora albida]
MTSPNLAVVRPRAAWQPVFSAPFLGYVAGGLCRFRAGFAGRPAGRGVYGDLEFDVTPAVADHLVREVQGLWSMGQASPIRVYWHGENLIVSQQDELWGNRTIQISAPDGEGLHRIGFGWAWAMTDATECDVVLFA